MLAPPIWLIDEQADLDAMIAHQRGVGCAGERTAFEHGRQCRGPGTFGRIKVIILHIVVGPGQQTRIDAPDALAVRRGVEDGVQVDFGQAFGVEAIARKGYQPVAEHFPRRTDPFRWKGISRL